MEGIASILIALFIVASVVAASLGTVNFFHSRQQKTLRCEWCSKPITEKMWVAQGDKNMHTKCAHEAKVYLGVISQKDD